MVEVYKYLESSQAYDLDSVIIAEALRHMVVALKGLESNNARDGHLEGLIPSQTHDLHEMERKPNN